MKIHAFGSCIAGFRGSEHSLAVQAAQLMA